MSTPRRVSAARRVGLIALGALGALLAIEVALQGVSFVLWQLAPAPAPLRDAEGARVVLCVGDSNTFGVGATDHAGSYPARLERAMNALGGDRWSVVNGAYPGKNSRNVLLDLPDQLATFHPEFVYVLVGVNDRWSMPAPVTEGEVGSEGFPLRWRTGRLALLVIDWALGERPGDAQGGMAPAFVGVWHDPANGAELAFEAGGRVIAAGMELRWRSTGPLDLELTPPAGDALSARWSILDDGRLSLRYADSEVRYAPGPPPAGTEFDNLFFHAPEPTNETAPSAAEVESRFVAACRDIARDPLASSSWAHLRGIELTSDQNAQLERILRDAIDRATDPENRARLLRGLCGFHLDDPATLVRLSTEATLLDGMRGPLIETLRRLQVDRAQFGAVLAQLDVMDADSERRLWSIHDEAVGSPDGYTAVLIEHLERIIAMARNAGATPVLLDYPTPDAAITAALRDVARRASVGLVELGPRFERELQHRTRAELFIPDGHCNDAGYEVLTEVVFEDLRRRALSAR